MRISDWSSDVCSSDLQRHRLELVKRVSLEVRRIGFRSVQTDQLACVVELPCMVDAREASCIAGLFTDDLRAAMGAGIEEAAHHTGGVPGEHEVPAGNPRSEEHTSELQSLMRI